MDPRNSSGTERTAHPGGHSRAETEDLLRCWLLERHRQLLWCCRAQEIEAQYRQVWGMEGVEPPFPQHYPKAVLLGCVDIVDCLPVRSFCCSPFAAARTHSSDLIAELLQAESIEAWPDIPESVRAEVGSPFGFLCEAPRRLVVRSCSSMVLRRM